MMSDAQLASAFGGVDEGYTQTSLEDEPIGTMTTAPPRLELNDRGADTRHQNLARSKSEHNASEVPNNNSGIDMDEMRTKIDSLKHWTLSTYKTTKQAVYEHLGKSERTVDPELEQKIELLRQQQRTYAQLLSVSRGYTCYVRQATKMQSQMATAMDALAKTEVHTAELLSKNAHAQRCIVDATQHLLTALDHFNESLQTMTEKVIEDTIITVRRLDHARLAFDAHRNELLRLQAAAQTSGANNAAEVHAVQEETNEYEQKYNQLKNDVQVKMQFLEENRVKVMSKQLDLLHQATIAYYAGNATSLQAILQQFSVRPSSDHPNGYTGDAHRPFQSFLEK